MRNALANKQYRDFTKERDKALERLLDHTNKDVSRLLTHTLTEVLKLIKIYYPHFQESNMHIDKVIRFLRSQVSIEFEKLFHKILEKFYALSKATYIMTALGEGEALGIMLGKKTHVKLDHQTLDQLKNKKSTKTKAQYLALELEKTAQKISNRIASEIIKQSPINEALQNIKAAFPKPVHVKRPKVLKYLTEADSKTTLTTDTVTSLLPEDEWQKVLDLYFKTELPATRFYNEELLDAPSEELKYAWQVENVMTEEFVTQVTDGAKDASSENGITDFVWIAVLDAHTDDCCADRDGMLISEIEDALKSGELDEAECDATVPPAHFNCRCRIAPVDKDIPERSDEKAKEFDQWLNS